MRAGGVRVEAKGVQAQTQAGAPYLVLLALEDAAEEAQLQLRVGALRPRKEHGHRRLHHPVAHKHIIGKVSRRAAPALASASRKGTHDKRACQRCCYSLIIVTKPTRNNTDDGTHRQSLLSRMTSLPSRMLRAGPSNVNLCMDTHQATGS